MGSHRASGRAVSPLLAIAAVWLVLAPSWCRFVLRCGGGWFTRTRPCVWTVTSWPVPPKSKPYGSSEPTETFAELEALLV